MRILNFDAEFQQFLFRGPEEIVRGISGVDPIPAAAGILEFSAFGDEANRLIAAHPLLKAAGFILNWDTRDVCVAYSESGTDEISLLQAVAGFDPHADAEFRWYWNCPVTARGQDCRQFYESTGGWDRFCYYFPFIRLWENGFYSTGAPGEDPNFRIENGVLTACFSTAHTVRVPDGVIAIGEKAFIGGAIIGSNKTMKELILPDSVIRIEKEAFTGCDKLSSVRLPESLAYMGDVFSCSGMREFTIPNGLVTLPSDAFLMSWVQKINVAPDHPVFRMEGTCLIDIVSHRLLRDFGKQKSVTVPEGITEICACAFAGFSGSMPGNLRKITLPESLRRIGERAFEYCSGLEEITIPDGVTQIGAAAFQGCRGLKNIHLSAALTELPDNTFRTCESLTRVDIPDSVTEIGNGCFAGCSILTDVTIPAGLSCLGYDYGGLKDTPWFKGRANDPIVMLGRVLVRYQTTESTLTLPDHIRSIEGSVFSGNHHLERIHLPAELEVIGGDAFAKCTALSEVVCPDSVTRIFMGAFSGCTGLKYLYAPNVTLAHLVSPMGSGKGVHPDMVAVMPKVSIANQTGTDWKMALCRGFLLHPELSSPEVLEENTATVVKQRKKLLPWVFAGDHADAMCFLLKNSKTTKAKLQSEYLTPAREAGAEKCVALLTDPGFQI